MLFLFLMALYLAVMNTSLQSPIGSPSVYPDRVSWRNRLPNEPVQARTGHAWNLAQTNVPDALSIIFCGESNPSIILRPYADCAGLLSAPVGLVHPHNATHPVVAAANHGPRNL